METETIYPNDIATASAANNGITNSPGVCFDINTSNPIFTPIDPTPETHINDESDDENQDSDDDDEDSNDDNEKVDEFKLSDKDHQHQSQQKVKTRTVMKRKSQLKMRKTWKYNTMEAIQTEPGTM